MRPGVSKECESQVLDSFRTLLRLRGALFRHFWGLAPGYSFRTLFGPFRGSGPEGPGRPCVGRGQSQSSPLFNTRKFQHLEEPQKPRKPQQAEMIENNPWSKQPPFGNAPKSHKSQSHKLRGIHFIAPLVLQQQTLPPTENNSWKWPQTATRAMRSATKNCQNKQHRIQGVRLFLVSRCLFLWYRGGLSLLSGIENSFLVSRSLFWYRDCAFCCQHLDRLLPGINLCALFLGLDIL